MCCGMRFVCAAGVCNEISHFCRCGLFWKAFGIVCLLFLGWQGIKLAIWMFTVSSMFISACILCFLTRPLSAYPHRP